MSLPIAVDETCSIQHVTLMLQDTTPHIQMGLLVLVYTTGNQKLK